MSDLVPVFPTVDSIPSSLRHVPDDTGLTLLLDGRLERWGGESQRIRSAVQTRGPADQRTAFDLRPAAWRGAAEGLRAVDTAARASQGGRGEWPRSSVGHRIACTLEFVKRAKPLRENVARALNVVGREALPNCLVEFDRTLQYVEDTVVTITPMPNPERPAFLAGLVEDALSYGARIANPPGRRARGNLFRPRGARRPRRAREPIASPGARALSTPDHVVT